MISIEKLKLYFKIFKGLSFEDLVKISHLVKRRKLAPNEIFIHEGATRKKVAYIKEGLVRAYIIKENGDEITTLLRWEDTFVASHDIILYNKASRYFFETLEKTELLEIDYEILQNILDKNPKFEQVRKHFLLKMLGESLDRLESFILLSPEERYIQLLNEKPNIVNRVPGKYIANILGITPVSLSRIRKRIASK